MKYLTTQMAGRREVKNGVGNVIHFDQVPHGFQ
jgi:hypothetical protein